MNSPPSAKLVKTKERAIKGHLALNASETWDEHRSATAGTGRARSLHPERDQTYTRRTPLGTTESGTGKRLRTNRMSPVCAHTGARSAGGARIAANAAGQPK